MRIILFEEKYRDDMIFMVLSAKNALGRIPTLNKDLLDIQAHYFDKNQPFWIALDEFDRVIGCIGTRIDEEGNVFLSRLYIKFDCKRNGIGSRLLELAENSAKERGFKEINVHLCKEYLESLIFYPKHGYVEYKDSYMKKEVGMIFDKNRRIKVSKIKIIISILVILIIIGLILYFISPNNDGLIYNLECEEPDKSIIDLNKKGKELLEYNGKYYLFVKLGEHNTGGYSIKIKDVKTRKNKVDVYVSTSSPGLGEAVTMAFTYPYDVVEFNKKPHGINIIYNNE